MAKAKPRPAPQPSAWSWLAGWTRVHGIDWNATSLPQAAGLLIHQLEALERNGQTPPADMLRLAALLVRIEGEMLLADAPVASPFLERAYVRERARSLARQLSFGPLLRPKPAITKPEKPSTEEPFQETLFDLVKEFGKLQASAQNRHTKRARLPV